jgi:hypothetical protein
MEPVRLKDVARIWVTDDQVLVATKDGRIGKEDIADYPRLAHASQEELAQFATSSFGIHWDNLEEDLCFDGFFAKQGHSFYSHLAYAA